MAGTLTISTLSDGTNSTSSTNCIQGSAKAWVKWNGSGSATINGSYNVSSVVRNSTGNYTINFTNAMADANYSAVWGGARDATPSNGVSLCAFYAGTTSAQQLITGDSTWVPTDYSRCCVTIFR